MLKKKLLLKAHAIHRARKSRTLDSITFANSEGRFVVELLKKSKPSQDYIVQTAAIAEKSVKAKNASFLANYRRTQSSNKVA